MRRYLLLPFFVLLAIIGNSQIAKWTFEAVSVSATTSTTPSVTAGSVLADIGTQVTGSAFGGLHASVSTWSTPSGNASSKSLSANTWAVGDYFQFLFKTTNYSGLSITWDATGSNTGPRDFKVQYSIDGSSFTDATGTNSTYQLTNDNWTTTGSPKAASIRTLDLSTVTLLDNQATVYIRLVNTSTTSIAPGTVAAGGTSRVDNFTVNGTYSGAITNFYSKSSGNLTDVTTWGINIDGSGTQPTNFTNDGQVFNVINRTSVTLDANWTVSGVSSKVIVGDGISPTTLILPSGITILNSASTLVDVTDGSTLNVQNNVYRPASSNVPYPYLGSLSSNSTVEYSHPGFSSTDTIRIPISTFGFLKLTGGLKYFSSGTTTVTGNITANGVFSMNGWYQTTFSTINLGGNFTLTGGSLFESIGTGDNGRITLVLTGSGTQTLSGGSFQLFRLQTLSTPVSTLNIVLSSASLTLGNLSSGGLNLQQATHTISLNGNTMTLQEGAYFTPTALGTITGTSTSNLVIDKTANPTNSIGTLNFTVGAELLNNFSYNCTSGPSTTLILGTILNMSGNLTLSSGLIDIGLNNLSVSGIVSGGSSASYIKTSSSGFLKLNGITSSKTFAIGNTSYNPLTIGTGSGNDFSARVETGINPAIAFPTYGIDRTWNILASAVTNNVTVTYQYASADANPGVPQPQAMELLIWTPGSPGAWSVVTGNTNITPGGADPAWTVTTASALTINTTSTPYALGKSGGWVLPLDYFITARSQKINNSGLIKWDIYDDAAVRNFEVQRSVNGAGFITIGTVAPVVNQLAYSFTDPQLDKGTNLYRIKVNRVSGDTRYSNTTAIINGTKGILITSVYPNPVRNEMNIVLSAAARSSLNFEIYDMAGKRCLNMVATVAEGNNQIPINTAGLPPGVYQLVATSQDAKTTYRFIKQ